MKPARALFWLGLAATTVVVSHAWPAFTLENPTVSLERQLAAVMTWALLLEGFGILAFPLIYRVFRALPDRGWFLSKWAGLLLVTWGSWVISSAGFLDFWPGSIVVSVIGLALMSSILVVQNSRSASRRFLPSKRWLWGEETLFWGVFTLFLLIRILNPDLWHPASGGEKPMELALLNAVVHTDRFPPADLWFSGEAVNYYYFGFVSFALLARLSAVPATLAFNLAIPTIGAFAALAASGAIALLVFRPRRKVRGSSTEAHRKATSRDRSSPRFGATLWGPLLLLGVGNLFEPRLLLSGFRRIGAFGTQDTDGLSQPVTETVQGVADWLSGSADWPYSVTSLYWSATRILPHAHGEAQPITEFPLFSLIFGDLHPHLIGLPAVLFLTAVLLATTAWLSRRGPAGGTSPPLNLTVVVGAALGIAALTNPWDAPLGIVLVASFFILPNRPGSSHALLRGVGHCMLTAGVGLAVSFPFLVSYSPPLEGIEIWQGSGTTASAFLWIHGLLVYILAAWLWTRRWAMVRRIRLLASRFEVPAVLPSTALGIFGLALAIQFGRFSGTVVILAILATVLASVALGTSSRRHRCTALLYLLGCGTAAVPEFVTLTADVGRMNVVFKLYYETWWLWSIASAACLKGLFEEQRRSKPSFNWEKAWLPGFLLLLGAALLYGPVAVNARAADRMEGAFARGLDGLDSMLGARFYNDGERVPIDGERKAIRWLQMEVRDRSVILEAVTADYGRGGRLSSAAGLPTLIGWPGHQRQQRRGHPSELEIELRIRHAADIYTSRTSEPILPLLSRYKVRFVAVGALERSIYGSAGLVKFAREGSRYREVFSAPGLVLYEVRSGPDEPNRGH